MQRLKLFILCLVNFASSRDVIELHFLFFVASGGNVVHSAISLSLMIFLRHCLTGLRFCIIFIYIISLT